MQNASVFVLGTFTGVCFGQGYNRVGGIGVGIEKAGMTVDGSPPACPRSLPTKEFFMGNCRILRHFHHTKGDPHREVPPVTTGWDETVSCRTQEQQCRSLQHIQRVTVEYSSLDSFATVVSNSTPQSRVVLNPNCTPIMGSTRKHKGGDAQMTDVIQSLEC